MITLVNICIIWALLASLPVSFLQAQMPSNTWHFGFNAGVSFSTGNPVNILGGATALSETAAVISDTANGQLLFYTDADNIYTKTHQIMPNGANLNGGGDPSQGALILKQPLSPNLYYVFTVRGVGSAPGNGAIFSLWYHIVDMNLNGGNGEVIQRDQLMNTNCTERICGIRKQNNTDWWIVTHQWQSNQFNVYQLNGSGLVISPIVSSVGSVHIGGVGGNWNSVGTIQTNSCNNRIAVTQHSLPNVELFDFNTTNGIVSNPIMLTTGQDFVYGTAFSPSGQYVYFSHLGGITQFDVTATNIQNSLNTIPVSGYVGFLTTGLDGKIYAARYQSNFLAAIENPDAGPGAVICNASAVNLSPNTAAFALPNIPVSYSNINSIFDIPDFAIGCGNDTILSLNLPGALSYQWFPSNTSGSSHLINSSGTYSVQVNLACGILIDTFVVTTSGSTINSILPPDTSFCSASNPTFALNTGSNAPFIQWNVGSGDSVIISTSGTYIVQIGNLCDTISDTINVTFELSPLPFSIGNDTAVCSSDTITIFTNTLTQVQWNTGVVSNSVEVNAPFFLIALDSNSCGTFSDSIQIDTIIETLIMPVIAGDTSVCSTVTLLYAQSSLPNSMWSTGATTDSISVSLTGNYWLMTSYICYTFSDTVTVFIDSVPPQFALPGDTSICGQDSILLSIPEFPSIVWNNGDSDNTTNYGSNTTIIVEASNACGTAYDTLIVSTYSDTFTYPLQPVDTLCDNEVIVVDVSSVIHPIQWEDGSLSIVRNITENGMYILRMDGVCSSEFDTIEVTQLFSPSFELGENIVTCDTVYYLNLPNDDLYFVWNPQPSNPITGEIDMTGQYSLTGYNVCGNNSDSIHVEFLPGFDRLYAPNVFTPNGDGSNDIYKLSFNNLPADTDFARIYIFDRWGIELRRYSNVNFSWDGTNNNGDKLPEGVYIIKIEAENCKGVILERAFTVTLIR